MAKRKRAGRRNIAVKATGKELVEQFSAQPELVERTEKGYKDFEEGRYASLQEVKRRLGDV